MALFSANQSFTFTGKNGVPRSIGAGELMSDSDPDFRGKEQFFEPVEVAAERPLINASGRGGMEDASAEPNTRRSISTVKRHKSEEAPQEFVDDLPKTK